MCIRRETREKARRNYAKVEGHSWSYGRWIYDYLCNQCPSPLTLWVSHPAKAKCVRYIIMWGSLSVTCGRECCYQYFGPFDIVIFSTFVKLLICVIWGLGLWCNATVNNYSAISWQSVLLVGETGVPGESHRPATSHWQTSSHNVDKVHYTVKSAFNSNYAKVEGHSWSYGRWIYDYLWNKWYLSPIKLLRWGVLNTGTTLSL
jgi:hypothetical protein